MNRQSNIPFNPLAVPICSAPIYLSQLPGRVPQDFIAAMNNIPAMSVDNPNIRTSDIVVNTVPLQKRAVKTSATKWRSSFKPVGEDGDFQDQSTSSPETEIYDPYDPILSDSEREMPPSKDHNQCPSNQDNMLGQRPLSLNKSSRTKSRWDVSIFDLQRQHLDRETKPTENRGLSHTLPEQRAYSQDTESLKQPGYGSIGRPLDHRVCIPDRIIHGSSTQQFPASYGGQRTNGEETVTVPEYRIEMTTAVRLSPSRLQQDFHHHLGQAKTGQDHITSSKKVTGDRTKNIIMDKNPITCDLCDVELANAQELEDHLDSRSHWNTLEYIQQQNNYSDMAIAFLQEVMLYKSHQCSRAIEDSALQSLQENDHMTKVELFHCAACNVFVATSASTVQSHITSQEHLSNTTEFEVQQRHACLSKAETIMKELHPQFEQFMKGCSPFE
uniref:uncharacterized protein LOC109969294 n=1 Tax=Monopterus albus TaxID=43700 RepID=UPI0009B3142F|nr:DBIRD complex subunit ZNF326 [Monopterus albus]